GITDDLARGAPPFPDVWPALEPLLRGAVLVGHNIGFDLALLRRECSLAGLPPPAPPTLDTLLLAGLLFPDMTDLSLEALGERLGVDIHGRHTALGDALVTAELYVRLLPLLDSAGIGTLAEARAFTRRATALRARQRAMGW
ncbi:MAG: 3'-5' exonuclease, partial [Caenispirillum sp.]|nr:3'-5' exonuclease [Caenispirillum sp.]